MLWRKCHRFDLKRNSWAAFVFGAPGLKLSSAPPFSCLFLSSCFSLLRAAFNRVQPAPPERTPTMSQSNPGKYLQTLSMSPQTDALAGVGRRQVWSNRAITKALKQWLKCFIEQHWCLLSVGCCGSMQTMGRNTLENTGPSLYPVWKNEKKIYLYVSNINDDVRLVSKIHLQTLDFLI